MDRPLRLVGAFLSAARRGAESTRKSHSYEDRVAERGFNTLLAWAIGLIVLTPLEPLPTSGTQETLPFRLYVRAASGIISSIHVLVWRSSMPLLSVYVHTWILTVVAAAAMGLHVFLSGAVAASGVLPGRRAAVPPDLCQCAVGGDRGRRLLAHAGGALRALRTQQVARAAVQTRERHDALAGSGCDGCLPCHHVVLAATGDGAAQNQPRAEQGAGRRARARR
jgi:hypothetical protein